MGTGHSFRSQGAKVRIQLHCPVSALWEFCKLLTPSGNGVMASELGRVLWELAQHSTAGVPRTKLGGMGWLGAGGARRLGGVDPEGGGC